MRLRRWFSGLKCLLRKHEDLIQIPSTHIKPANFTSSSSLQIFPWSFVSFSYFFNPIQNNWIYSLPFTEKKLYIVFYSSFPVLKTHSQSLETMNIICLSMAFLELTMCLVNWVSYICILTCFLRFLGYFQSLIISLYVKKKISLKLWLIN